MYDAKVMAERKTRETWFFRVCCFVVDPLCTPCDDRASTFLLLRRDTFAIPADYEPFLSFLFILYQCWIHHYRVLPIPGWKLSVSKFSHGSKKKKKEKLAVTMDRFVIHTRRNTRSGGTWNVVIESSLTDESYHLDISSSLCPLTHTIRFYLKVSRNISLWASSIEHGFTDVRDPGSRRIVAVLFLARGTDRGGNAWIAINDAEQKRSIPWWNVAERNGGVPFGTNGETINETFSFHGRR